MKATERDIGRERSGPSRTLAVVCAERFRIVESVPEALSQRNTWALELENTRRAPRINVTPAARDFKLADRLRVALREFSEILIATSGLLAVLSIVLVVTMLLRAIRALCRH